MLLGARHLGIARPAARRKDEAVGGEREHRPVALRRLHLVRVRGRVRVRVGARGRGRVRLRVRGRVRLRVRGRGRCRLPVRVRVRVRVRVGAAVCGSTKLAKASKSVTSLLVHCAR